MRIAQQLYEGVDIKGNGTVGVITYLRTDSTRISEEADAAARAYIAEHLRRRVCGGREQDEKDGRRRFRMPMRRSVRRILPGHRLLMKESLSQRSVPSVSADLETFCGKPDAAGQYMRLLP